ncbi:MAG: hypothetical protein ABC612_01905 [Candidatus Methanosuratincola petrocarbonis]|nr:hypothetical protein [Candidatus Methanosuratincola sp.]
MKLKRRMKNIETEVISTNANNNIKLKAMEAAIHPAMPIIIKVRAISKETFSEGIGPRLPFCTPDPPKQLQLSLLQFAYIN